MEQDESEIDLLIAEWPPLQFVWRRQRADTVRERRRSQARLHDRRLTTTERIDGTVELVDTTGLNRTKARPARSTADAANPHAGTEAHPRTSRRRFAPRQWPRG